MDRVPHSVLRVVTGYLQVRDCLRMEFVLGLKLYDKAYYVKRFELEPLYNSFRLFKKGVLRTYKLYSYIKDSITYSEVTVAPVCSTFICKHKNAISPSAAQHWLISCITEGKQDGCAYIEKASTRLYISTSS